MRKKLIFGAAFLLSGLALVQAFRIPQPLINPQLAHAADRPTRRAVSEEVTPGDRPQFPEVNPNSPPVYTPNYPDYPDGVRSPQDLSPYQPSYQAVFSPESFDRAMVMAHQQLRDHLKSLAENKIAPSAKQAEFLRALAKYSANAKLESVASQLEDIIDNSPDTDEARRAAAAIEALKGASGSSDKSVPPPESKRRQLRQ